MKRPHVVLDTRFVFRKRRVKGEVSSVKCLGLASGPSNFTLQTCPSSSRPRARHERRPPPLPTPFSPLMGRGLRLNGRRRSGMARDRVRSLGSLRMAPPSEAGAWQTRATAGPHRSGHTSKPRGSGPHGHTAYVTVREDSRRNGTFPGNNYRYARSARSGPRR